MSCWMFPWGWNSLLKPQNKVMLFFEDPQLLKFSKIKRFLLNPFYYPFVLSFLLERLIFHHLRPLVTTPGLTTWSLPTSMVLEWSKPSTICCTDPSLTWSKREALGGSCFLTSPVLSTPSSLHCWEGSWREPEWTSGWLRGPSTTSPTDHST